MLPVHCVPQTKSLYSNRIQQPLYVSKPESADHAKWTGETSVQRKKTAFVFFFNYHNPKTHSKSWDTGKIRQKKSSSIKDSDVEKVGL